MKLLLALLALSAAIFGLTPAAQAHQYCGNIYVGMSDPPLIGMDGATPIYGNSEPIYEKRCVWKYGTVAIDPHTRQIWSAWNYDNPDDAQA